MVYIGINSKLHKICCYKFICFIPSLQVLKLLSTLAQIKFSISFIQVLCHEYYKKNCYKHVLSLQGSTKEILNPKKLYSSGVFKSSPSSFQALLFLLYPYSSCRHFLFKLAIHCHMKQRQARVRSYKT